MSRSAVAVGGVLLIATALAKLPQGRESSRPESSAPSDASPALTPSLSAETAARVKAFCSDCHALPRPESLSRERWYFGVRKGYEFYAKSGRHDLDPPPPAHTLAYFRARAPARLSFPQSEDAATPPQVRFEREAFPLTHSSDILPEISHLRWTQLAPEDDHVLLACDMRHGHVTAIDLQSTNDRSPRILAQLRNPARVEPWIFEANAPAGLLVADLGSYLPADHNHGRAVLLRRTSDAAYDTIELATGLGRVADVRPIDVDYDGRGDLVVAEFGWQRTGGIHLLRNVSRTGEPLRFERRTLDDRPGAIHVSPGDINGDGRADILALVSQEQETIDVFLNAGDARFRRRIIWTGADLTFGSSGIEPVDLDGDGDLDVLYTNGDTFDNAHASPWHGAGWLENRGQMNFTHHRLTEMTGAYRALAGDFDGDGDRDVVAVAWLPANVQPPEVRTSATPSIVYLEQTAPGTFARHTLERGSPVYATLEVADFDRDGDLDFAVAPGPNFAQASHETPHLTVWWNRTHDAAD